MSHSLKYNVWKEKYAVKGETTYHDMHSRMASEFARIRLTKDKSKSFREWTDYFFGLFQNFKYIVPQGSVMSVLGSDIIGSLSNCFVVGQPEDSYGGIMQKDEELTQLMKRRGGVGVDISSLRPRGASTTNAARTSTGAVTFAERYSNTTREVAQSGRRGALMITMDIRHPDVIEFISAKEDKTKITGANISIKLRDEFMHAVQENKDYVLRWPCEKKARALDNNCVSISKDERIWHVKQNIQYNTLRTFKGMYYMLVNARDVWNKIVTNARNNAEPGIMFWDTHLRLSPDSQYELYRPITTNPCGEIAMSSYDACRLILINLYSYVESPFTDQATFDFKLFYKHCYQMQLLADDLVDLEIDYIDAIISKVQDDPEPVAIKMREVSLWQKVRSITKAGRRTGCGITALGDALAALGIKYGSSESLGIVSKIMKEKMRAELNASIDLAQQLGPFEGWSPDLEKGGIFDFIEKEYNSEWKRMQSSGRRNVSWSTVAPAGTCSLMTETTSGIEPLYDAFYTRRRKIDEGKPDFVDQSGDKWEEYLVIHPKFKIWLDTKFGEKDWKKEELRKVFKKSPWYRSRAEDLDYIKRLRVQAIVQKYTSHSISSTLNLPEDVTIDTVGKIYFEAWALNIKGVTVYREGSRSGVLVKDTFKQIDAVKRPKTLEAERHAISVKGHKHAVIVGLLDNKPYEVFARVTNDAKSDIGTITKVKKGHYEFKGEKTGIIYAHGDIPDEHEAITRLASGMLRHGASVRFVVELLNKTPGDLTTFGKAIARTLKKYIKDGEKSSESCPECGGDLIYEEGCAKCRTCGNSIC